MVLPYPDSTDAVLQIDTEVLETFEEESVPLSGVSTSGGLPSILLYSFPAAGLAVLGCSVMLLLQDRREIRDLESKLAAARRVAEKV